MCGNQHQKNIPTAAGQFCLDCGKLTAAVDAKTPTNQKSRQRHSDDNEVAHSPAIHGHSGELLRTISPVTSTSLKTAKTADITPQLQLHRQAL
ncbi:MAG TPA: hypothetical protein VLF41_02795 [Candidatus Nanoarchaeia archaeon]|nr:hypothetical protein [Candidatus Nanoarchaeia archaeon]